MNPRIFAVILALAALSTGLFTSAPAAQAEQPLPSGTLDMVLASIDDEPLTVSDLKQFLRESGQEVPEDVLADRNRARLAVEAMVRERLLQKEAEALGISADDSQVAAYLDEIKKQNNTDEAGLLKALQERGLSLDDYKKQIRSDIIKTRIIASQVRGKVTITDDEIMRYAKEHPGLAPAEGQVHLLQIHLKADPGDEEARQAALRKITSLRTEIAEKALKTADEWQEVDGAAFSDLGFVEPTNLLTELEAAVTDLEEGGLSEIIQTNNGFYLLFVVTRAGTEMQIDPIRKEQIRRELYQQQLKKKLEEFSQHELPAKYQVEYKL